MWLNGFKNHSHFSITFFSITFQQNDFLSVSWSLCEFSCVYPQPTIIIHTKTLRCLYFPESPGQVHITGPFLAAWGMPPHRPPVAFLGCHIQDIHTTPTGSQLLLLLSLSLFPSLWSLGILKSPPILQLLSETHFLPKQCPLFPTSSNELLPLNLALVLPSAVCT